MYLSHKCFHCHSFQTVNCKIVGRMQSLMATVMKLAYITGHLHTMCYISNNSADNKIYKSTTIRTTTVLRPLQDNRRSPALTVKNYKSTKNNSLSRLCNTNLEFLQTLQSMMFSITIHF